ncbi:hypothetical protein HCN44_000356 [Aphidius gifuensis]|uniref:Venom protein n=1 Tax=Aphidius gifuensis TaxID=684658 RepID=A0A834XPI9_APHGI|nr:hypothetical protein HCN44_000356 [Aphidius gifuensis]
MKHQVALIFFISVTFFLLSEAQNDCRKNHKACSESVRCCSKYCRDQRCIEFGDDPSDVNRTNPCFYTRCSSDEVCVVKQYECTESPCPGRAACVSSTPISMEN